MIKRTWTPKIVHFSQGVGYHWSLCGEVWPTLWHHLPSLANQCRHPWTTRDSPLLLALWWNCILFNCSSQRHRMNDRNMSSINGTSSLWKSPAGFRISNNIPEGVTHREIHISRIQVFCNTITGLDGRQNSVMANRGLLDTVTCDMYRIFHYALLPPVYAVWSAPDKIWWSKYLQH